MLGISRSDWSISGKCPFVILLSREDIKMSHGDRFRLYTGCGKVGIFPWLKPRKSSVTGCIVRVEDPSVGNLWTDALSGWRIPQLAISGRMLCQSRESSCWQFLDGRDSPSLLKYSNDR